MDISKYVFHPPVFKEEEICALLQSNESLHFTAEIGDNGPNFDELLRPYVTHTPLINSNHKLNSRINSVLSMPSNPSPFQKYSSIEGTPSSTSDLSKDKIPFLVMRPPPKGKSTLSPAQNNSELVFVLFHSNAEDMFRSANLGRKIVDSFEVRSAH